MTARRAKIRSPEESRRLRVDVTRLPEWRAEIEAIRGAFRKYSTADVARHLRTVLELDPNDKQQARQRRKESLSNWERTQPDLSGFLVSSALGEVVLYELFEKNLREMAAHNREWLAKSRQVGESDSALAQIFRGKFSPGYIAERADLDARLTQIESQLPKLREAVQFLTILEEEAAVAREEMDKIHSKIWLAEEKKQALEEYQREYGTRLAKAARSDDATRAHASKVKRIVPKTDYCPYCEGPLGNDCHLDHIYPVAKGGLSVIENLVWCCKVCNEAKCDRGLMQFASARGFSSESIIMRLIALGKHI